MSNTTQYVFKPRDEVADYIDENIESWTGFCYDALYQKQRENYQKRFERIGFRMFVILIGMIVISLSYITISVYGYLVLVLGGISIVIFGFIMLSLEVRNGRRVQQ